MKTTELLEKVNTQIIALMDEHGQDWTKPWVSRLSNGMPCNVVSGNEYSGINVFITSFMSNFESRYWATYKQWTAKDAQVKKGEKCTHIFYLAPFTPKDAKTDSNGNKRQAFVNKCYAVFNADQVEGWTDPDAVSPDLFPNKAFNLENVEQFIQNTTADVRRSGESAFYAPSDDFIQIPEIERFNGTEEYYGTLLHELTHWTGHKSRCDRFPKERTRESYAKEELVAEIGAAQLCALLDVEKTPREDHAKYLNYWMEVIAKDDKALMVAFSRAGKAVKHLQARQEAEKVAA